MTAKNIVFFSGTIYDDSRMKWLKMLQVCHRYLKAYCKENIKQSNITQM